MPLIIKAKKPRVKRYNREEHMYTSEIKSDLTIPEQILEVYYNKSFIEEIKKWLFNQYKKINQEFPFSDFEDVVLYSEASCEKFPRVCDGISIKDSGDLGSYIRYKIAKGDEITDRDWDFRVAMKQYDELKSFKKFLSTTQIDYQEVFGWSNCIIEISDGIFEDLFHYGYGNDSPNIKKGFKDFLECYPQHDGKYWKFVRNLFFIEIFLKRSFYKSWLTGYISVTHDKYCLYDLKKHVDLLEDMIAFFTPQQKKSERSTIDF